MTEYRIEKVKQILQRMIDGRINIFQGCAELSALRLEGYDLIYQDFDEYYG